MNRSNGSNQGMEPRNRIKESNQGIESKKPIKSLKTLSVRALYWDMFFFRFFLRMFSDTQSYINQHISLGFPDKLATGRPTGPINAQVGVHDRRILLRDCLKDLLICFEKKKNENQNLSQQKTLTERVFKLLIGFLDSIP